MKSKYCLRFYYVLTTKIILWKTKYSDSELIGYYNHREFSCYSYIPKKIIPWTSPGKFRDEVMHY